MLLHKEKAIIYNYLIEIKLKQLYCHFKYLFIQRLAKVLKQAKYANIN
jgi:predicted ABC-type exoprotein transport system permease subunit